MTDETPPPAPSPDPDKARRRSAKLLNERLKLLATFLNGVGIAILVAGVIIPLVSDGADALTLSETLAGLFSALVLHLWGQIILTFFRSEE